MLILTLKENDKVFIGKEIRVRLIKIEEKQIQLEVEANTGVKIRLEDSTFVENTEIINQKGNTPSKSMIQILEEDDPALADLIKKLKL